MKNTVKTLVATAFLTAVSLAGCSSSNNNSAASEQQSDPQANVPIDSTPGNTQTDEGGTSSPGTSIDLRNLYDDSLRALAGYELETLSGEIALIADSVAQTATSPVTLPATDVILVDQTIEQSFPVTSVQYDCPLGGSLTIDTLAALVSWSDYSSNTDRVNYQFEQCRIDAGAEQVLDGAMSVDSHSESGSRYSTLDEAFKWQEFQWQKPDNQNTRISATIAINVFNTNDYSEVRNVAIGEYSQSQNSVETSGIHDASFSLSNSNSGNGGITEYRLNTSGTIIDSSAASIAVLTDPEMYQKQVAPGLIVEAVPFNGQISFTADDGSSLKLIAVQPGDTDTKQTDVVYTSSNGEVSTQQADNFTELVVFQP